MNQYVYDAYGQLLSRIDGAGTVQEEHTYCRDGERVSSRYADGNELRYTYGMNDLEAEISTSRSRRENKAVQKYQYDSRGRIIGITDGNGNQTGYDVDGWGRIRNIHNADSGKERYTYDYAGNITSTTDPNGGVITYRYNSQGKVCEIIDQEGNSETFRYDREGRMILHTDRNGNQVQTTYNVDGNPVLETAKDPEGKHPVTRSWEYDPAGNVKKAVAGGFCYTYEYRADGKLMRKSSSGRTLLSCTYLSDGSLESLTDVSGKKVSYRYDWNGRLSAVLDENGQRIAAYAHTPGGKLKEIVQANGIRTRYGYDTDGNIIRLRLEKESGETISDLSYEYDLNGNRTLKAGSRLLCDGSLAEQNISYRYDSMDRLVSEIQDGEKTEYLYDLCGNRLKKLDKSGRMEYNYNRKNQLTSRTWNGGYSAYHYDRQGNLLAATGTEGTTLFSYDVFNQQTAVTMPEGGVLENRYDAEYLRAGTVENGQDGDTIGRYILGYGVAAGWNREKEGYHPYHLDEQNSTAYITGANGEIENNYQYDAFGVIREHHAGIHNRILYTGQQYDQISGQYYLRARYYNPIVGRFLQEDVYRGDGLNLYAYCANNPVVYYDPSGYNEESEKCELSIENDSETYDPSKPLSPSNYPNPDPDYTKPPVRYDPQTPEELYRMQKGRGPTSKKDAGDRNIEAHHRGQKSVKNGGILDEIEESVHRKKGNHSRHTEPSQLTPQQRAKEIREHYKQRAKEYKVVDGKVVKIEVN